MADDTVFIGTDPPVFTEPDPVPLGTLDPNAPPPAVDMQAVNDQQWEGVRSARDKLLSDTDWVVTKSAETGEPVPVEWRTYRKALRDITTQLSPFRIEWPVAPVQAAPTTPTYTPAPDQSVPLDIVGNTTLQAQKAAKSAELLVWRMNAERAGFDWNGQWFETAIKENVDFQAKLQDAVASAKIDLINHPNAPFLLRWPLINNGYVDLMREHLVSVGVRMDDNIARIYQKSRNLQALIDGADADTLATINWDSLPLPPSAS